MRRPMLKFTAVLLGAGLAAVAFAQNSPQAPRSTQVSMLMSIQTHGNLIYLADGHGYPLYTLVASRPYAVDDTDPHGDPGHLATLPCGNACQALWTPATVASADPNINDLGVVDTSLIGTTRLENGAYQLTYNGYPLYYNQQDLAAPNGAGGAFAGQAVEAFGGIWYILHADTGKLWNPHDVLYYH